MHIQSLQPTLIVSTSYLNIVSATIDKLTIKVLDVQGRIAKTVTTTVEQGMQQLVLNLEDLSSGMYVLNAFTGGVFLKSIRFVKE
jgi:hypothetical protein